MRCPNPKCKSIDSRVLESRSATIYAVRRRRECLGCNIRFTTYEILEDSLVDPRITDSLNQKSGSYLQIYLQIKDFTDLKNSRSKDEIKKLIKFASENIKKYKDLNNIIALHFLRIRGKAKFDLKDYEGAIEDLSKVIELDTAEPKDFQFRGTALCKLENYEGAITDFSKSIELFPADKTNLKLRGDAKCKSGNYLGAIEDLSKVIRMDPKDHTTFILRGEAKLNSKNYKGAIKDFSKGIELIDLIKIDKRKRYINNLQIFDVLRNTEKELAFLGIGQAKNNLGDFKNAIKNFSIVIEINPKNIEAYLSRGNAKLNLQNFASAIHDFYKVIELDPPNANELISSIKLLQKNSESNN